MAKRGGGVCRAVGGSLPRDVAAAVVFSSARGGAAAARASDEAFAEILAGEPWQMRVDVPGGPLAAEAGVPPGRTFDDDDGDVGAGDEDGDGDEFSGAEPRRHPWRPLVTHVRVPRLPKDALVEVQPILLDRDGPGVPAPDRDDASGSDSDSGAIGDGDARGVAGANESGPGGSRCESLHRPGRFCCAHVAVPSGKVDEVSVGWAVSALSSALTRAGLTWAHAGTARGYVERGERFGRETAATVDRALAAVARVGRRRGWNVGVRARARPGGERVWGGGRGARPGTVGRDGVGEVVTDRTSVENVTITNASVAWETKRPLAGDVRFFWDGSLARGERAGRASSHSTRGGRARRV